MREHQRRVLEQERERLRSLRDAGAEEVGRPGSEHAARRHRVAAVAPVLGPRDRLRPLRLQVRAGRPVEERLLQLTPAPLEARSTGTPPRGGRIARDRHDGGSQLAVRAAGVVAPDARVGRAAEVQRRRELVRVRAGRRVRDRMRPVDDLELLVAPRGALGALVRAVADLDRLLAERLGRVGRVEDELDHLPVALVRVVEVVEDVEDQYCSASFPGLPASVRDVRVDGGRVPHRQPLRPLLVEAARVERVAREVEVVLEAVDEVGGDRRRS